MAYQNKNICRSFNITATTAMSALTSQVCSEVIVYNRTGGIIEVYDKNFTDPANAFILSDSDSFVVRGITNSNEVSVVTLSSTGPVCYRTQYFSSYNQ